MKKYFYTILFIVCAVPLVVHATNRALRYGMKGQDVTVLQQLLNKDSQTQVAESGAGAPGNESMYFGKATLQAVKQFQSKYAADILNPLGLTVPSGVVGDRTWAKLLSFTSTTTVTTTSNTAPYALPRIPIVLDTGTASQLPTITAITPAIVTSNNQTVTVTGTSFTSIDNVAVFSDDGSDSIPGLPSADGKTITFQYNYPAAQKIVKQIAAFKNTSQYNDILTALATNINGDAVVVTNGVPFVRVTIAIKNIHGQSATATFIVDLISILKNS